MISKILLLSMEEEGAPRELIGKVDGVRLEQNLALQVYWEQCVVVGWEFVKFWDA
jgi:hypothetical protein